MKLSSRPSRRAGAASSRRVEGSLPSQRTPTRKLHTHQNRHHDSGVIPNAHAFTSGRRDLPRRARPLRTSRRTRPRNLPNWHFWDSVRKVRCHKIREIGCGKPPRPSDLGSTKGGQPLVPKGQLEIARQFTGADSRPRPRGTPKRYLTGCSETKRREGPFCPSF